MSYYPQQPATRWKAVLCAFVIVACCAAPGMGQSLLGMEWVETKSTTIGPNGELFHVQAGMQLDLFPTDPAAGWNTVLALDVVRDGELAQRLVIPGTEGTEIESDAALLADGDQLFVLWMSRAEDDLSHLELIAFDAAASTWGAKVDVSGDPRALVGAPDLSVTRESVWLPPEYDETGAEITPPSSATRTVVHVLWQEIDAVAAEPGVFYTPIVLADGEFLGWNPVVALDAAFFGLTELPAEPGLWSTDLLHAAALEQGTDERSVIIGLPHHATGSLINLVVRMLPEGLVEIAEEARSHIIGVGLIQTGEGNGELPDFIGIAEAARSHIIGVGLRLHRGVREYVANQVAARILEFGAAQNASGEPFDPAALEQLAADAWAEALATGASLVGNQLRSEDLACGLLHLGEFELVEAGAEATESRHQVEFCISSEFSLPETAPEAGAPHRLISSEDGTRALVVWQDAEGSVHYRRTDANAEGGWTSPQTVPDDSLDLDQAATLLRSQVRIR